MSIRTNKMKAVPVLLKQLMTARSKFHEMGRDESFDGKLEKLRLDLNKIKDVFVRVKKNEETLLDTLAEVYEHLRKLDRKKLDEDMDGICKRIKDSAHKLLPMDALDDPSKEEDHKGGQIFNSSQELQQPLRKSWTPEDYHRLSQASRDCLLSLVIFPENAVIRKRNAIHLWIGEGLIDHMIGTVKKLGHDILSQLEITQSKTAEECGEDVIDELLKYDAIVRYGNGKCPLFNKFRILPGVRRWLESYVAKEKIQLHRLELQQKKVRLGDWLFGDPTIRTIFNIGASYLNFRRQWVTQVKNLEVLQLGRWQDSPLHHIEVGSEEFLKELRNLTQLKYLSLRGISRIFQLPSSIAQLERLLILDLKACHNLETLPNDISSMKSLTHLILSQCYLLEGMPKGIEKLTNLQVLKGFVISTSEKTPCRISDLANLRKLRRLSIHIGSEAVMRDREFERLEEFEALEHLKISWSVSNPRYANIQVILPARLSKLHLEGFPGKSLREWFMASSRGPFFTVAELNISGGKLEIVDVDGWYNVAILRLKYLKQLNVDINNLKPLFPFLRYVEIKQISNHSYVEKEWEI